MSSEQQQTADASLLDRIWQKIQDIIRDEYRKPKYILVGRAEYAWLRQNAKQAYFQLHSNPTTPDSKETLFGVMVIEVYKSSFLDVV